MKKKIIKVLINPYDDREKMISALAQNGYKVWVEEKKIHWDTNYYVVFEQEESK